MEGLRKIGAFVIRTQLAVSRNGFSSKAGLLSDVNVLDLSRVIAGPVCSMSLGDLGANVIKVESLDGDEARRWGPPFIKDNKDSFYFLSVNRNKKSICIDLKSKEGKLLLHLCKIFYPLKSLIKKYPMFIVILCILQLQYVIYTQYDDLDYIV